MFIAVLFIILKKLKTQTFNGWVVHTVSQTLLSNIEEWTFDTPSCLRYISKTLCWEVILRLHILCFHLWQPRRGSIKGTDQIGVRLRSGERGLAMKTSGVMLDVIFLDVVDIAWVHTFVKIHRPHQKMWWLCTYQYFSLHTGKTF